MALAFLAVLGRIVLVRYYAVPSLIRWHMADFCFAGFFTFFITSVIAPFRRRHPARINQSRRRFLWLSVPIIGTFWGLWIELEDYLGIDEEEGGFDLGLIIEWTGAPNTDTFDWWDLLAIGLGGVLALYLQHRSVRMIDRWRWTPLMLHPETTSR